MTAFSKTGIEVKSCMTPLFLLTRFSSSSFSLFSLPFFMNISIPFRFLSLTPPPDRVRAPAAYGGSGYSYFNFRAIAGYDLHRFPLLSVLFFFLSFDISHDLFPTSVTDGHSAVRWVPEMSAPQLPFQFRMQETTVSARFPFMILIISEIKNCGLQSSNRWIWSGIASIARDPKLIFLCDFLQHFFALLIYTIGQNFFRYFVHQTR